MAASFNLGRMLVKKVKSYDGATHSSQLVASFKSTNSREIVTVALHRHKLKPNVAVVATYL